MLGLQLLLLFMLTAVCAAAAAATDYYTVLGVSRDADENRIKKAYRDLVRIFHPDKNKNDKKAEETFIAITAAYDVLGDKEKRKQYDGMRHEDFLESQGSSGGHHRSSSHSHSFKSSFSSFSNDDMFKGFDDMFDNFNGKFFNTEGRPMQNEDFLDMDDILFDPLWEEESSHFGTGRSYFGGDVHFKQNIKQHTNARRQQQQQQEYFNQQHRQQQHFSYQQQQQEQQQQHEQQQQQQHFNHQHQFHAQFSVFGDDDFYDYFEDDDNDSVGARVNTGSHESSQHEPRGDFHFTTSSSSSSSRSSNSGGRGGGETFTFHERKESNDAGSRTCRKSTRTDANGHLIESTVCTSS